MLLPSGVQLPSNVQLLRLRQAGEAVLRAYNIQRHLGHFEDLSTSLLEHGMRYGASSILAYSIPTEDETYDLYDDTDSSPDLCQFTGTAQTTEETASP